LEVSGQLHALAALGMGGDLLMISPVHVLYAFILNMTTHNVYYALTSHCRYNTTQKFAQPGEQDEESRGADVREETGIGIYKTRRQTGRIHTF
jgi:hypothetical protein